MFIFENFTKIAENEINSHQLFDSSKCNSILYASFYKKLINYLFDSIVEDLENFNVDWILQGNDSTVNIKIN